jgi:DNA-binding transcriptional regulator YhcF (GntR family)
MCITADKEGYKAAIALDDEVEFKHGRWASPAYMKGIVGVTVMGKETEPDHIERLLLDQFLNSKKYNLFRINPKHNTLEWRGPRDFMNRGNMGKVAKFLKHLHKVISKYGEYLRQYEVEIAGVTLSRRKLRRYAQEDYVDKMKDMGYINTRNDKYKNVNAIVREVVERVVNEIKKGEMPSDAIFNMINAIQEKLKKLGINKDISRRLLNPEYIEYFKYLDGLKVDDDLYLRNTKITSLPDNLEVGGSLNLEGTPITSLPDNLKVGGDLILEYTLITSLPDNLEVGGSLYLYNTKITSLPDNLKVGGSLDLQNTPITSLPNNLEVGGDLSLMDSKITSLSDNLKVGGDLYLINTPITSIPDNLEVGGDLDLSNTKVTSLPDNLKVGGNIYKDFSVDNNIKESARRVVEKIKLNEYLTTDFSIGFELEATGKEDGWWKGVVEELNMIFPSEFKANFDPDPSVKTHGEYIYPMEVRSPVINFNTANIAKMIKFLGGLDSEHDVQTNESCGFHVHASWPDIDPLDMLWVLMCITADKEGYKAAIALDDEVEFKHGRWASPAYMKSIVEIVSRGREIGSDHIEPLILAGFLNGKKYNLFRINPKHNTLEWRGPRDFMNRGNMGKIAKFLKHLHKVISKYGEYLKKYEVEIAGVTLSRKKLRQFAQEDYVDKMKDMGYINTRNDKYKRKDAIVKEVVKRIIDRMKGGKTSSNTIYNVIKAIQERLEGFGIRKNILGYLLKPEYTKYLKGIKIEDDLNLYKAKDISLPDGLEVGGNLDLSFTNIVELPDNLKVGGNLQLSDASIKSIPSGLEVGGFLFLSHTPIANLPDDLKVGGGLYLANTPITSLPDGLKVDGHLDLRNTPITSLPDNLKVGGYLDLGYTSITSLPDNLEVGGNLDLEYTPITSLPDNLKVGGNLDLRDGKITSLPDGLKVGRNLYIQNTSITSLPDDLKVGSNLFLDKTKITSIPDGIRIGGNWDLSGADITNLPDNLKVGNNLILTGTPITSLPDGLDVSWNLDIRNTKITSLPDDLKVGGTIYKDF